MPLCVARRCHALRVSRPTTRLLQSAPCAPWRHVYKYSTWPIEGGVHDDAAPSKPTSAIIIPRSVAVTPDDLIKHITPLETPEYRKYRFAVFLLTPAFAPWLLDDHHFLQKAVHQAFSPILRLPSFAKVHAFAAVVDKLPSPQSEHDLSKRHAPGDDLQTTIINNELGHEGLAYKFLRSHNVVRSTARTNMDEKGSISFFLSERSDVPVESSQLIRLPLANTVFQTGTHATMSLSSWEKPKGHREMALVSKSDLTHQEFRAAHIEGLTQSTALTIPLIPLTMPRVVEAAMGNILRRVVGPDGKTVTASEELEKVVPQYFKSRGEPSQAISVWALLIPEEQKEAVTESFNKLIAGFEPKQGGSNPGAISDLWAQLWKREDPFWGVLIVQALNLGCRIHRVLSGGGGWGKKAGLLSLDPSFNNEELGGPAVVDLPSNIQKFDEISSALHQVVKPGESIQFFASPTVAKSYERPSNDIPQELQELNSLETPWTWEFGTIPSTADALQSNSWQHNKSKDDSLGEAFVFPDNFGALSEGGLTLRRESRNNKPNSVSVVSGYKLDVPFTRILTRLHLPDVDADASQKKVRR